MVRWEKFLPQHYPRQENQKARMLLTGLAIPIRGRHHMKDACSPSHFTATLALNFGETRRKDASGSSSSFRTYLQADRLTFPAHTASVVCPPPPPGLDQSALFSTPPPSNIGLPRGNAAPYPSVANEHRAKAEKVKKRKAAPPSPA